MPAPSHLLAKAAPAPRQRLCLLEAQLLGPALAYPWDHRVAGRPLLPGSALLEVALAAGHSLLGSAAPGGLSLAAQRCSISAPLALSGSPGAMVLQAEVALPEGSVTVRSKASRTAHLASAVRQCPARLELPSAGVPREGCSPSRAAAAVLGAAAQQQKLRQPAFQVGALAVDPTMHMDGYYCQHPAVVDATLHLGASLAPAASAAEEAASAGGQPDPSAIRVPVGVEAVACGQQVAPWHARLHALGQLHSLEAGGTATSSYTVQQGGEPGSNGAAAAAGAAVQIAGLEARPLRLPAAPAKLQLFPTVAVASSRQPAAADRPLPLLYQVGWEVHRLASHAPLVAPLLRLPATISLAARPAGAATASLGARAGAGGAAAAVSRLLSGLQQLVRMGSKGGSAAVATLAAVAHTGGSPARQHGAGVPEAAAAAWGMVRVAASEVPDTRWSLLDLDLHAPGGGQAPGAAEDVSGTLLRSGLLLRPMLRTALPAGALAPANTGPAPLTAFCGGRVVVTGGLGGALPPLPCSPWAQLQLVAPAAVA